MKKYLFAFVLFFTCSSYVVAGSVSECRFDDESMEIFGLAAYGYAGLKEKSSNDEEYAYLYVWKGEDEKMFTEKILRDSYGNMYGNAILKLKNIKNIIAYALVWKDKSLSTKYGEVTSSLRVNAGYSESAGYDVFFNADDMNLDGVEVGCGVNLLLLP